MTNKKNQYIFCQLGGWLCAYLIFSYMIMRNPFASPLEYGYSGVLFFSGMLFSHVIRLIFKRCIARYTLWIHVLYFGFSALLVATLSTMVLLLAVFVFAYLGWSYPIPQSQWAFVIEKVFFANAFNMLGLSLLWSTCYLALIKVRQLHDAKASLQASQLQVLNNQLNPHFLFNAINDLRALILEHPQQARTGLAQLSDMLRYSLQPLKGDKVELEQELACAQNYLALCKIALEHRLTVKFDIDAETNRCLVPKLILQLCLENAVKHGIAPNLAGGEITISIRCSDDYLQIEISNPLVTVRTRQPGLGIGTKNLQDRLQLLYQDRASMELRKEPDKMCVKIVLPKEFA